ncbi:MAG: vWA domain-containing protein [Polyangiaceae bacterium]
MRKSLVWLMGVPLLMACSAGGAGGNGSGVNSAGAGSGAAPGTGSNGGASSSYAGAPLLNFSGSDGNGTAGSDVSNGECAHKDFDLKRKPAEILIVLDRSASMKETPDGSTGASKWDLVVPGVNEVVTQTDASVSWGLKVFPEGEGSECVAGAVTNAIPVMIAAANAKAVTAAVTATTPEGNGTPTGDAIKAAVTYLKTLSDPNPKFILLATDGEPSCAGTSKDATSARPYAVQAVTDAATAGFKTFVVGVATTKATATQALNDMAVAGQMPRDDTNPLATKFYLASTKDELVASLKVITGQVSSCVFDLTDTPPDASNIAVKVNGVKAPRDTTHMNGWDYTSADYMQVEVFGDWCNQISVASADSVNFILGCPNEVIP